MAKRWDYYERELVSEIGHRFAKNSRARRLNMRLSQSSVAFHMRDTYGFPWHQTMVGKIEGEQRQVRLDEAFALCRVYGIGLEEMLRGQGLDLIRDGRVMVNLSEGSIHVYAGSFSDPDAPLTPLATLLADGEKALEDKIQGRPLGDRPSRVTVMEMVDDDQLLAEHEAAESPIGEELEELEVLPDHEGSGSYGLTDIVDSKAGESSGVDSEAR